MPNHIQNRLTVTGKDKDVIKLLTHIKGVDSEGTEMKIDFNKIKKMPESLNITSGSLGQMAHELLFGTVQPPFFPVSIKENQQRFAQMDIEAQREAVDLAIKYQDNLNKYGHTTWYDWNRENWGTKWNAYAQNDERSEGNIIYFQTAWSAPIELIRELSGQFPKVTIQLDYADEDSGSNTGNIEFKAGEITQLAQPNSQSKEGYDIYFDLHPDTRHYYNLVGDKYEYIDEE